MKLIASVALIVWSSIAFAQKIDTLHIHKTLRKGWNLIAFPHSRAMRIDSALSSVWSKVQIVKDEDFFYVKTGNDAQNLLTHLKPMSGYWIKLTDDCDLVWDFIKFDTTCVAVWMQNPIIRKENEVLDIKPRFSACTNVTKLYFKIIDASNKIVFESSNGVGWNGLIGSTFSQGIYTVTVEWFDGLGIKHSDIFKLVLG